MSKWIGIVPIDNDSDSVLGNVPPLPASLCAGDIIAAANHAALTDKKGRPLASLLQETAAGSRLVVVLPLAAESPDFCEALIAHFSAWIAYGVCLAIRACMAEEVVLYVADRSGAKPLLDELLPREPLQGVKVIAGSSSPVLREDSALLAALSKLPVRSGMLDTQLSLSGYDQRPTLVLDVETTIWLAASYLLPEKKPGKLMLITQGDEKTFIESPLETTVADILASLQLFSPRPMLLGGITGTFITGAASADVRIAYAHHSDTLYMFDENVCMASIGARLSSQAQEMSCGKCVLCREGSWQMASIFRDITEGRGRKGDLDLICDMNSLIQAGSFCSLGRQMAGVLMSLVVLAREELSEHISRKRCPAGVCTAFQAYAIDPNLCQGCGLCMDACKEDAIEGKPGYIHRIDLAMCTKCAKCREACPEKAVVLATGRMKLPKKPTKVGCFR